MFVARNYPRHLRKHISLLTTREMLSQMLLIRREFIWRTNFLLSKPSHAPPTALVACRINVLLMNVRIRYGAQKVKQENRTSFPSIADSFRDFCSANSVIVCQLYINSPF